PKLRLSTVAPRSTATLKPALVFASAPIPAGRALPLTSAAASTRTGRSSERPPMPGGRSQPAAPTMPPTWLQWPTASLGVKCVRRRDRVGGRRGIDDAVRGRTVGEFDLVWPRQTEPLREVVPAQRRLADAAERGRRVVDAERAEAAARAEGAVDRAAVERGDAA